MVFAVCRAEIEEPRVEESEPHTGTEIVLVPPVTFPLDEPVVRVAPRAPALRIVERR